MSPYVLAWLVFGGGLGVAFGLALLARLIRLIQYREQTKERGESHKSRSQRYDDEYFVEDDAPRPPLSLPHYLLVVAAVALVLTVSAAVEIPRLIHPTHWQAFTSTAGRFQVEFPEPPAVREMNHATPVGAITETTTSANRLFQTSFAVQYIDTPARSEQLAGLQDQFRDLLVSRGGAKIISSREVKVDDHAGQEDIAEFPWDGRTRLQIVSVGSRLYLISAHPIKGNGDQPEVDRFFKTFTFTP